VAAYSDELGEWTAAQITDLDPAWKCAGVLELDWSGPEPHSMADLGELKPLVLSHHAHTGRPSHTNYDWLLPRGYKVLGNAPLVHDRRSSSYGSGWRIGLQLDAQRRWDAGDQVSRPRGRRTYSGHELATLVDGNVTASMWDVSVSDIDSVDCAALVEMFPNLTRLSLSGNLGTITNAEHLNRLARLKTLFIHDLFGMTKDDCVLPSAVPNLEMLGLHSVPADYAAAMKRIWSPERASGTFVEIRSPRKPEWVEGNRDNPLRDWDGREHISSARYRKSIAQYRATRQAILEALTEPDPDEATLTDIGRQFGDAFNQIDGNRDPFIETEEREELFAALDAAVTLAEGRLGRTFVSARGRLYDGVEAVRNW